MLVFIYIFMKNICYYSGEKLEFTCERRCMLVKQKIDRHNNTHQYSSTDYFDGRWSGSLAEKN